MEKTSQLRITWRSILISFLLIPFNCYWSIQRGLIWGGPPTTLSLFYNVIFCVFVLTVLNIGLKHLIPGLAFRQSELLTIYSLLSMATAIGGFDTIQVLIQVLGHPFWFATAENEWRELFWRYIPRWLTVDDFTVLKSYYNGDSTFYLKNHIYAWLRPVAWWSAFLIVMSFVMLCLASIFRQQWTEREKLSYPNIQLPLEMTKKVSNGILGNYLLWVGFGIAGGLNMLNSLHYLMPTVPEIKLYTDISSFFTEKPWSSIGRIRLRCFPYAIGIAFFIPLDLSFSCWFFFLFWKLQRILGSMAGLHSLPGFPYAEAQSAGSYICIGCIALWFCRRHFQHIWKSIVNTSKLVDIKEPMPYRLAVTGFLIGTFLLILFAHRAGMKLDIAVFFFSIYLLLSITITRMRAEIGHPAHELYWRGPDSILLTTLGPKGIGSSSLSIIALFWGFTRAQRGHVMPHQLEAFKLASTIDNKRRLVWATMCSILIGTLVSFWILLDLSYERGALRPGWGGETIRRLESWITTPTHTDVPATMFMGFGFVLTLLLMVGKTRWFWIPFHPVGYPLGPTFSMVWLWFSFFLGWVIKWVILKHGGLGFYRRSIPLFLGLILGEFVIGGGWSLIGVLFQIPVYVFWH